MSRASAWSPTPTSSTTTRTSTTTPTAFRPERFLDESPGTYTWIPFGGGRRRCLGASFALLEMKIVIAVVLAAYGVRAPSDRPEIDGAAQHHRPPRRRGADPHRGEGARARARARVMPRRESAHCPARRRNTGGVPITLDSDQHARERSPGIDPPAPVLDRLAGQRRRPAGGRRRGRLPDSGLPAGRRSPATASGSWRPVAVSFAAAGIFLGWNSRRYQRRALDWVRQGREPDDREHRLTLRLAVHEVLTTGVIWVVASAAFGLLFWATESPGFGAIVAAAGWLGGETTCALYYLLLERALRPLTALALASRLPERPVAPGVTNRLLFAWSLGTGVPILGVIVVGVVGLAKSDVDSDDVAAACVFLGVVASAVGLPGDEDRRPLDRRSRDLGSRRTRPRQRGRPRRSGADRRRERGRPAAGRLQPHGRRPARARAHPRPVRPPGRPRGGPGGASRWRPARRRGARDRRGLRRPHRVDLDGPGTATDRGGEAAQPVLPRRDRGRRVRGRAREQVRGRCGPVRVRRPGGERGSGRRRAQRRPPAGRTPGPRGARDRVRDRRFGRHRGGGQRRLGESFRIHGDRRPRKRGIPTLRPRQAAPRAPARLRGGARAGRASRRPPSGRSASGRCYAAGSRRPASRHLAPSARPGPPAGRSAGRSTGSAAG